MHDYINHAITSSVITSRREKSVICSLCFIYPVAVVNPSSYSHSLFSVSLTYHAQQPF